MKKHIISFLMLGLFFAGGLLYAGCADSPSGPEPLKTNDILQRHYPILHMPWSIRNDTWIRARRHYFINI